MMTHSAGHWESHHESQENGLVAGQDSYDVSTWSQGYPGALHQGLLRSIAAAQLKVLKFMSPPLAAEHEASRLKTCLEWKSPNSNRLPMRLPQLGPKQQRTQLVTDHP